MKWGNENEDKRKEEKKRNRRKKYISVGIGGLLELGDDVIFLRITCPTLHSNKHHTHWYLLHWWHCSVRQSNISHSFQFSSNNYFFILFLIVVYFPFLSSFLSSFLFVWLGIRWKGNQSVLVGYRGEFGESKYLKEEERVN